MCSVYSVSLVKEADLYGVLVKPRYPFISGDLKLCLAIQFQGLLLLDPSPPVAQGFTYM